MDGFFFSCDWIVDYEGIKKLDQLIRTAATLKCELGYVRRTSDEGYTVYRLTIQVLSELVAEEFMKQAANQMGLINWRSSRKPEFLNGFPTTSEFEPRTMSIWLEGILSIASDNQALRKMLETHQPSYFACDWIVPTSLEDSWLDKFIRAYGNSGKTGAELRVGEREQTKKGLYTQRIMVRLLTTSEFEKFLYEMKRISGPTDWSPVSKEEFLKGIIISGNSKSIETAKQSLLLDVYKMSQANSRM